jgi:hypothetical protein
VTINVSEEHWHTESIFRVTLDTGIAGSSSSRDDPALKMESERSPEMSVTSNKTERCITQNTDRCGNLRSNSHSSVSSIASSSLLRCGHWICCFHRQVEMWGGTYSGLSILQRASFQWTGLRMETDSVSEALCSFTAADNGQIQKLNNRNFVQSISVR